MILKLGMEEDRSKLHCSVKHRRSHILHDKTRGSGGIPTRKLDSLRWLVVGFGDELVLNIQILWGKLGSLEGSFPSAPTIDETLSFKLLGEGEKSSTYDTQKVLTTSLRFSRFLRSLIDDHIDVPLSWYWHHRWFSRSFIVVLASSIVLFLCTLILNRGHYEVT